MPVANIVTYQISRAHLVGLANFEIAVTGPFNLRPVEFTILQLLKEGQCTTPGQMSKELQMSPPSMSVWLDKLTERDLIQRSKSDNDGRTQFLQLTEAGDKLTELSYDALMKSEKQLLSVLSPGEQVLLLEILHKLNLKASCPSSS
jgi:DNA-binding MarR family transcriptional regulator